MRKARGFAAHSSVQFSCSVVSDYLWPHGLQHARLPCPWPMPRTCLNSCPLSLWCHPTISSSVIPFSSCLQSFPASGSFPMSQFFALDGQSIGASGLISFRIDWLDFLAVQGMSQFKSINFSMLSLLYGSTLTSIHDHWKNHTFD